MHCKCPVFRCFLCFPLPKQLSTVEKLSDVATVRTTLNKDTIGIDYEITRSRLVPDVKKPCHVFWSETKKFSVDRVRIQYSVLDNEADLSSIDLWASQKGLVGWIRLIDFNEIPEFIIRAKTGKLGLLRVYRVM